MLTALENIHRKIVVAPQAIKDNGSWTTNSIDTHVPGLGKAKYVMVEVVLGATDVALAALKMQEADDDSTYADITGLTYASALPGATDDNKIYLFAIPMEGRKRYLDLVATAGNGTNGTFLSATAHLWYTDELPSSDTHRGIAGIKYPT